MRYRASGSTSPHLLRRSGRNPDRTRRDDPHHARGAPFYVGDGGIDVSSILGAHPTLRLPDRAAQQGAARGDRLCRTRDAVPRDAEGVYLAEHCAKRAPRQGPFRRPIWLGTGAPPSRPRDRSAWRESGSYIKAVDAHVQEAGRRNSKLLCTPSLVGRTRWAGSSAECRQASSGRSFRTSSRWRVDFFDAAGDTADAVIETARALRGYHRRQAIPSFSPAARPARWRADRDRRS